MELSRIHDEVSSLLRRVAAEVVLPRYQALAAHEVDEKSPGELVTIVDREAEALISPGLLAMLPGSRVVGEEAAAERPGLLDGLDEGVVWLVDPLDGTANFVEGKRDFAIMVALLCDGETVASWMLAPAYGWTAHAERGAGAFVDGCQVRTAADVPTLEQLRGAFSRRYLPPEFDAEIAPRAERIGQLIPNMGCAGVEYPSIAAAERDFCFFWRTLPWDHAPGALFLQEAGGVARRVDGESYLPADGKTGLLVARNADICERVLDTLMR